MAVSSPLGSRQTVAALLTLTAVTGLAAILAAAAFASRDRVDPVRRLLPLNTRPHVGWTSSSPSRMTSHHLWLPAGCLYAVHPPQTNGPALRVFSHGAGKS
jgi:hypothetical protein